MNSLTPTADAGTSRAREALLNALYASASEVPAWVSFTQVARSIFGCDHVAVMVGASGSGLPVGAYSDEAMAAEIESFFASTALQPNSGIHQLGTAGGAHVTLLPVADSQKRCATIILWRQGESAPLAALQEELLASLSEPLRRSLQIYYRIMDLARRGMLSDLALNTSRIGAALVSSEGELMLANDVAEHLLAAGGGLRVSGGRLQAESAEETRALLAEIKRCALAQAPEPDLQNYVPMAFSRRDHALPLTIIVRPGPGYFPLRQPNRRTAILVLRDPAAQAAWPAETLARLFGLSAAEALLASKLAKGASLEEAATVLGISRNTVRSQLQSIFLKTGINRQSDLIRALLNSAATSA
ncbi:MAG TPA: helix-turn-helix transcriptional regulator [Sphingobium sp.]|nr:helix-turn-helix transcriptional regulator [Sphingobium sp.]